MVVARYRIQASAVLRYEMSEKAASFHPSQLGSSLSSTEVAEAEVGSPSKEDFWVSGR